MYDKRAKDSSSEIPGYSNMIPESCSVEGPEIPVPGYFRLSQTYATGKRQEYCHETTSPNTTLVQLNRVIPKSQATSFVDIEKKIPETPHNRETRRTPTPVESPDPKSQEEKNCSTETSASSPELPQKEAKGGYNKRINRVAV